MLSRGKLYVVGIGPGDPELLTLKALNALRSSDYILGHKTYIDTIRNLVSGEIIESGMGEEVGRVRKAIELAEDHVVSLVSGGDPSIYGMASLVAEIVYSEGLNVDFEVIPGVTAMCVASPLLGSAISGDVAVVSLSDLLVPWEKIEKRLRYALKGDFVVAVYNPSSRRRMGNLIRAMEIVLEVRGNVPIGKVRNASRRGEEVEITTPEEIMRNPSSVDMHTILFISNSETRIVRGKMITPRGYRWSSELMGRRQRR